MEIVQNMVEGGLRHIMHNLKFVHIVGVGGMVILLILLSLLTFFLVKPIAHFCIQKVARRIHSDLFSSLVKHNGFNLLANLMAATVFWLGSVYLIKHSDYYSYFLTFALRKLAVIYFFFTVLVMITRIIKVIGFYYQKRYTQESGGTYQIANYVNVIVAFIWVVSVIFLIAFFANTSPWAIVTGIGAVSTIFLLLFRDILLGFVASIQAAASNIVKIGDRICIDKYNLDGIVSKIAVNVVTIQNTDNTDAIIPTYMLTSEVIKNWRRVNKKGARLIRYSLMIDADSIVYYHKLDALTAQFNNFSGVKEYLTKAPTQEYITNLALFRAHIENYLLNHNDIRRDADILVHLLLPDANGVPVEVYAFSKYPTWYEHEHVQSETLEYCFATARFFQLRLFKTHGPIYQT